MFVANNTIHYKFYSENTQY